MNNKLIVFDLDETLRKLEFNQDYNKVVNVRLRPNIKSLLEKLKEVKENGTDVMIYTTASDESAHKYFLDYLPEEYRDVFDRIISKDNRLKVESGSKEEQVYGYDTSNKPVTAIDGYNQILFFDDNKNELQYLRNLYREENEAPDKQVVFASYAYNPPKPYMLYALKKLSEENEDVAKYVNIYFDKLLEEPGCELMIKKIDEFEEMEFSKGLVAEDRNPKCNEYSKEERNAYYEIDDLIDEDDELAKKCNDYMEEYFKIIEKNDEKSVEEER